MKQYLFSSVAGTFVFDEQFHIISEFPLAPDSLLSSSALLAKGLWMPIEEKLAQQHGKDMLIIGFKADPKGHVLVHDAHIIGKVRTALRDRLFDFSKANVKIAKRGVRDSLRIDDLIIQCSRSLKEQEKVFNTLVARLREWYELYNPEPSQLMQDHEEFVNSILAKSKSELLVQFGVSADETMGADFSEQDLAVVLNCAKMAKAVIDEKIAQRAYLEALVTKNYPNTSKVATPFIAAELISIAGSLERMAMMPSSTVQLLGAEKALFKHLRNAKVKPPKHGIIVNHPLMAKVPFAKRGRLARVLADKISFAVRIDFFKGEYIGDSLLKSVEDLMLK